MLRIASVGVSTLIVLAPILEDAAAPEMAIAAARSRFVSCSSTLKLSTYPVARLPTYLGVNAKKSASRPRWLAYFDPRMFNAALMIGYGTCLQSILLSLISSRGKAPGQELASALVSLLRHHDTQLSFCRNRCSRPSAFFGGYPT